MKNLSLIFGLNFLAFLTLSGQVTERAGLYYGPDSKPFTGIHKEMFQSGGVQMEISFANGIFDGETRVYHPNGELNELRSYKQGKMHGVWKTWNDKGIQTAEARYLDGEKDGKWYVWGEKGVLLYDMSYDKGKRTGTWKMYNEEGVLVMERVFN